jgi:hypothetical protein
MARPKKEISPEQVERFAAIGCTDEEIGVALNCSSDTLTRRFAESLKRGREACKTSLRRMQWKSAKAGNVTMQIWLGKQLLEQKDRNDITSGGEKLSVEVVYRNKPKRANDSDPT